MIAICDHGAGNLRSLSSAVRRAGFHPTLTRDPQAVSDADVAILPGVGSAGAAVASLRASGLAAALASRVADGRPLLAICPGMQLLTEWSEEDGGTECLGLLPGKVTRLRTGRVPRIGWARVDPWGAAYYFAHSYQVESPYASAQAEGVTAAVEHGSVFAVQFHPEKSGAAGEELLRRRLAG